MWLVRMWVGLVFAALRIGFVAGRTHHRVERIDL